MILGWWRDLNPWGSLLRLLILLLLLLKLMLLELLLETFTKRGRHGLLDIRRADLLSCNRGGIINIVLASGWVVVNLLTLTDGGLNSQLLLHVAELLLLLIKGHLLLSKLGVLGARQIELLELLGCGLDISKLLLKSLLLLGKVQVGGDELSIQVGIHMLLGLLIHGKLGRGQNLVDGVLLVAHHVLI